MDNHHLSSLHSQKLKQIFRRWFLDGSPKTLNILITGKTGVGKSRLVNALVGKKVATEGGEKIHCTSQVTSYEIIIENVKVTVWDSPGLQDGTENESAYIQEMKDKIKDIALMIYCVRMDATRFYEHDKKAFKILTEEFGPDIWKHSIVGLTFANKVEDPDRGDLKTFFKKEIENWKEEIDNISNASVCIPPLIPVGNVAYGMRLPDRENWLSDLWIECYKVMKDSARQGMYRINKNRLKISGLLAVLATPSATSTGCDTGDDIPEEIHFTQEQEDSFLKSTWEAITSSFKIIPEVIAKLASFSWTALKSLFTSDFHDIGIDKKVD